MMNECTNVPLFEADQVLTAEQLNQLRTALDHETRLTRSHMLGVGIICGLEVRSRGAGSGFVLTISEGVGVTSAGRMLQLSARTLGKKRPYTSPGSYAPLPDSLEALELLASDVEDMPEITALKSEDLQGRLVLLYLEEQRIDNDSCAGASCDQLGITLRSCVKALLVPDGSAAMLMHRGADGFPHGYSMVHWLSRSGSIPYVRWPRPVCPWAEAGDSAVTATALRMSYQKVLQPDRLQEFLVRLNALYGYVRPAVRLDYPVAPWKDWNWPTPGNAELQPFYAYILDLVAAYNELRETALRLAMTCTPNPHSFPKHLLLGPALTEDGDQPRSRALDDTRHHFMSSALLDQQRDTEQRVGFLFRRLVLLSQSWALPLSARDGVKVTASASPGGPLGEQSIPFYYQPQATALIREYWNFQFSQRQESGLVEAYHTRQDSARLAHDINDVEFFRVEGHLGGNYPKVLKELRAQLTSYQLPFHVIGLRLADEAAYLPPQEDCLYEPFELAYLTERSDWKCRLAQVASFLSELELPAVEQNSEPAKEASAAGRLVTAKASPVSGAELFLKKLTKAPLAKASVLAVTDLDGQFRFDDLSPGKYSLLVNTSGYAPKEIPVDILSARKSNIGDIVLEAPGIIDLDDILWWDDIVSDEGFGASKPAPAVPVDGGGTPRVVALSRALPEPAVEAMVPRESEAAQAVKGGLNAAQASSGSTMAAPRATHAKPRTVGALVQVANSHPSAARHDVAQDYFAVSTADPQAIAPDDFVSQVSEPLGLLTAIDGVTRTLRDTLNKFTPSAFQAALETLVTALSTYRSALEDSGGSLPDGERADILRQLGTLEELSCAGSFVVVSKRYSARLLERQRAELLEDFARLHPGLEYRSGVSRGGTFVLVYDKDSQVVADFCLPHVVEDCCGTKTCEVQQTVFSLPQTLFCKSDTRPYKFTTSPPGGEVRGPGVFRDPQTGEYHFQPSRSRLPRQSALFYYELGGLTYDLKVDLEELSIELTYEIESVDMEANEALVHFEVTPASGVALEWDFGDGSVASGSASLDHRFDLSDGTTFLVTVSGERRVCRSTVEVELNLEGVSASFTLEEVEAKREADARTYLFQARQAADSYDWDLGPDGSFDVRRPEVRFSLGDQPRTVSGSLVVTAGVATDSEPVELELPAAVPLLLSLPGSQYCTNDTDELAFVAAPAGGTLTGPGVVERGGQWFFTPSDPALDPGLLRFTYTLDEREVTLQISLTKVLARLGRETLLVDWEEGIATVRLDAAGSMGSALIWELGDGTTSTQDSLVHGYKLDAPVAPVVRLMAVDGGCQDSAEETLSFEFCSGDFSFATRVEGSELVVDFAAVEDDAESEWNFGDGSVGEKGQRVTHRFQLGAEERATTVTLRVTKGVCRAGGSRQVFIPAAAAVTLGLGKTTLCAEGPPVPVIVQPKGGTFSPEIVEEEAGLYMLRPSAAKLASGTLGLEYRVGLQTASQQLRFVTPRAVASVESIQSTEDGLVKVQFANTSVDANRFDWRFTDGQLATVRSPTILIRAKSGDKLDFELAASWDGECPDILKEVFTVPGKVTSAGGPGRVDTSTLRGGLLDAATLAGDLKPQADELLASDETMNEAVRELLDNLAEESEEPARLTELTRGESNSEWGEKLGGSQDAALTKLVRLRTNPGERGPFVYNNYRALTRATIELLSAQAVALKEGDALLAAAAAIPEQLATFKREGISVDTDGSFKTLVLESAARAKDDPLALAVLEEIASVL